MDLRSLLLCQPQITSININVGSWYHAWRAGRCAWPYVAGFWNFELPHMVHYEHLFLGPIRQRYKYGDYRLTDTFSSLN